MRSSIQAVALFAGLAAAVSCPVITTSVTKSGCPPANCTTEDCIEEVKVTVPCSCVPDLPLSTVTTTAPCCRTGCATTTDILYLPCAYSPTTSTPSTMSTSTTTPAPSCPIVTVSSVAQPCPPLSGTCTVANCIEEVMLTVPCSCEASSLSTTTVSAPCCHTDCATSTTLVYVPACPTSPTSSTTSSIVARTTSSEGPGCPAVY